ncbi:hypothetical protein GWO43_24320 [candidate division KSB1 bacterium]|nr:hypothetical protein [candidate division KSB1 bacterium]NIR68410.1 hypothetical protein [candidate division KSB1 bacterium]NIS27087.1 hypothetical protein [candidate division KSB1 bacterium]NIT73941.1 hypothetical protein [candidate division KSB1 bacterium]NIU27831.1 hypothetical protein [candidate division KSB1 bacterium]
MSNAVEISEPAALEIENWLRSLKNTVKVKNVERDPIFQKMDVDLIWTTKKDSYKIEIKADQWHKTGNFFFETLSNEEKKTPGCFMYTEADLLFYYFVEMKRLYILPMPQTRKWFLSKKAKFKERATTTPVNGGYYTTVGKLVPIDLVLREVRSVKQVQLQ